MPTLIAVITPICGRFQTEVGMPTKSALHPLYLFSGDHAAGQVNGEGANQFGGRWYAVNTAGNEVSPKHSGGTCNPVCSGY